MKLKPCVRVFRIFYSIYNSLKIKFIKLVDLIYRINLREYTNTKVLIDHYKCNRLLS